MQIAQKYKVKIMTLYKKYNFAKNKLTKFRFMTIIKLQNKISHKTKVKK